MALIPRHETIGFGGLTDELIEALKLPPNTIQFELRGDALKGFLEVTCEYYPTMDNVDELGKLAKAFKSYELYRVKDTLIEKEVPNE